MEKIFYPLKKKYDLERLDHPIHGMSEITVLSHHSSIMKLSLFMKALRSMLIFWDMLSLFLHVVSEDELFKCIPESEP